MSRYKAVIASIEPLARTLSKVHKVSIAIFSKDERLLYAGQEGPLESKTTVQQLRKQASISSEFDLCLDGIFISSATIKDTYGELLFILSMARSKESVLSEDIQAELLRSLATTLQSCINYDAAHRSAILELMEKYEELTLLYDISERLEHLPSLDDVADEMLLQVIERVRCKAGRLIVLDEEQQKYFERIKTSSPLVASTLAYDPANDPAAECFKTPITQVVNNPVEKGRLEELAQLHVPICLKKSHPIGVLSLFRMLKAPFKYSEKKIVEMMAKQTAGKIESALLYSKLEMLFLDSIRMLVECIDARDSYTRGHSVRVSYYAVYLARAIGLPEDQVKIIEIGALLHDVGKIRIRDHILNKPGRLTEEEYEIIKRHPEYGMRIVEHIKQLQQSVPCIYCHHESYDGKGYPRQLAGEEIPLMGRIVAIADTFDAMTTTRPYRKGLSQQQAYDELLRFSGIQFDPELAAVFAAAIQRGEFKEEPEAISCFKASFKQTSH
ncbi:MAG: HD-GYP domain-containing protein [Acidobacteriota bacterium]|nr:HD-GYP domain-containing protein [Blastocatellia bacterium]MDW8413195.1 HD-GYP domain-containing protein [Acidobacteriota bacterium]